IVRHPVVEKVVQAYEECEDQDEILRQEIAAQRRAEREQKVRSENETNLGE
ncbi:MAG: PhoH family protein, partial [Haemophilus parainfluenzae]